MIKFLRIVWNSEILSRAMDLCIVETGDCIWPDIPEKYWAQAVDEMIGLQKR